MAWTLPVLCDLLKQERLFTEGLANGTLRSCPGLPGCAHGAVAHLHYQMKDGRRVVVYDAGKRLPQQREAGQGMMGDVEHRKVATRIQPAQPEQELEVLVSEYTCDRCGSPMPEHNASGGYLPKIEGTVPRNSLRVSLNREHFSGEEAEGRQFLTRDYCDACLPGIWAQIAALLAYWIPAVKP